MAQIHQVSNLYELMNSFRDKGAIMNKDFVLDFVAGGMSCPAHNQSLCFSKILLQNHFLLRCVCCSEQDCGGPAGKGEAAAPDSGE